MEDRYGPLPDATVYLLEAASLRLECERIGIAQIDRKRAELQIRFTENATIDPQHLMRLVARNAKRGAQFTPQGVLKFPLAAIAIRRSSARDPRACQQPRTHSRQRLARSLTLSCQPLAWFALAWETTTARHKSPLPARTL